MNKTLKLYIGALIVIVLFAVSFESTKPTIIDWTETYNERHTSPYGLKVLHQELPRLFDKAAVTNIRRTAYEFFTQRNNNSLEGNYLAIRPSFGSDESSLDELLDFAYEGNTVFISSHSVPKYLREILGFKIKYGYKSTSKATLGFHNRNLKNQITTFEKGIKNVYFSKIDTLTTIPLGYQEFENDSIRTNFIKVPYGDGAVLVHTQPVVFTNYHLLKDKHHRYSEGALAYIPNKDLFFDSLNKTDLEDNDSPLRFILSQPPLRWAWLLSLMVLLVFILFNVKRKQRIVKIINPLQNTTVDFTKTIGNLYYETKDHDNVVKKKITYFLEHIRNEYLLDTNVLDQKFIKRLALKSGKDEGEIEELLDLIITLKKQRNIQEQDVLKITKAMERFNKKE